MAGTDKVAIIAKYRGTERFKDALKIIKPTSECREACERDLATALWGIDVGAKIDKSKSVRTTSWVSAQYKHDLRILANTLETAANLAAKAFPLEYQTRQGTWRIEEGLKRYLKETEQAIDWTSKRVKKGSPKVGQARIMAVDSAYLLLKKYGKKPRGVSHEGPWQDLARALLNKEKETYLFRVMKWRVRILTLPLER